jgi:hypothetical protein
MKPAAIVLPEGLGKFKKFNDLTGKRIRDLPLCTIVPQPTTLQRDPKENNNNNNVNVQIIKISSSTD